MKDIKLRLAARCEAAGRPNNEDNYQVMKILQMTNGVLLRIKNFR